MLTCKEVSELVSHSMDRRLGWLERWRLRVHLKACEGCRNFQKQMTFVRTALRNHPVIRDARKDKDD
ncbi:MAG TPA: zf-HC2 domain-containing protein [Burkholderiales bacterium]